MAFILTASIIALVIFIVIFKEYISLTLELHYISKEFKKYTSKNNYEIRKLFTKLEQSTTIYISSKNIEEKLHWCEIIIDTYKKMKIIVPNAVHSKIEKKIYKYMKIFGSLNKMIKPENNDNLPNSNVEIA